MNISPLTATCPHCFGRINMTRAVFRCSADSCSARESLTISGAGGAEKFSKGDKLRKKPDPHLEEIWEDTNPYNHTFSTFGLKIPSWNTGWRFFKARANCPASRIQTTDRLCPICHKSLYSQFGEGLESRLTLIGATNTGKSNYIAVLVREMRKFLDRTHGAALMEMNTHTIEEYGNSYHKPIYEEGERVLGTKRVESLRDTVAPMVFGLKKGSSRVISTFSFFDPPGEGVINERAVERFHRFVFNSHGLVLLIDGENLLEGASPSSIFNDAEKVLGVATRQIEADSRWNKRLKPYLAIAISKADLLHKQPDMPPQAFERPNYDMGFDQSDFQIVSSGVEALIRRRGGGHFCNSAQVSFGEDRVGFFAVSAFGSAADERTGKISKLEPLRVVDPFLWLMSKTGVMSAIEGSGR